VPAPYPRALLAQHHLKRGTPDKDTDNFYCGHDTVATLEMAGTHVPQLVTKNCSTLDTSGEKNQRQT
jgi:hypothetical protein